MWHEQFNAYWNVEIFAESLMPNCSFVQISDATSSAALRI